MTCIILIPKQLRILITKVAHFEETVEKFAIRFTKPKRNIFEFLCVTMRGGTQCMFEWRRSQSVRVGGEGLGDEAKKKTVSQDGQLKRELCRTICRSRRIAYFHAAATKLCRSRGQSRVYVANFTLDGNSISLVKI